MGIGKFIGCVMMVVGSAIGAGILAMPMVSAFAGFTATAILMVCFWGLLTISGLLIAEMSSALPIHACSFNSMAEKTMGPFGRAITWGSYLLLLYSLLSAYISGESVFIVGAFKQLLHIQIAPALVAMLFTSIMGIAVLCNTKTVDHFNRGLISVKGVFLIAALVLTIAYIDFDKLFPSQNVVQVKHILSASPILLCIFNYHFVIPSLRIYVGDKPQMLKWIIIVGTTISLIVYLLWLAATLGTVPLDGDSSFSSVARNNSSLDDFIKVLTSIVNNKWVKLSINGFAGISMTTSFLGVSLGLFDFLADGFRRPNTKLGRLQTSGMTFIPPFLFVLFYPNGFVLALNYSAVFVAILCLILPAIMVYRLRKNSELISPCRVVYCGSKFFCMMAAVGLIFSIFPILTNLGLLK